MAQNNNNISNEILIKDIELKATENILFEIFPRTYELRFHAEDQLSQKIPNCGKFIFDSFRRKMKS